MAVSFPMDIADLHQYLCNFKVVFLDLSDFKWEPGLPLQTLQLEVDELETGAEREAFVLFHSGYFKHDVNDPVTSATTTHRPDSQAVPTRQRA